MKAFLIVVGLAAIAVGAWALFGRENPQNTAKLKCEYAIESLSGLDIGLMEVSRATVEGDVFNGRVVMPFEAGGQQRRGECEFMQGKTEAVRLDGQLLAGR